MQNEMTVLTKNDNIFDYFGDELTVVVLILECKGGYALQRFQHKEH